MRGFAIPFSVYRDFMRTTGLDARDLDETLAQLANAGVIDASAAGYALVPEAVRELASLRVADPVREPPVRKAKRGRARSGRSSR